MKTFYLLLAIVLLCGNVMAQSQLSVALTATNATCENPCSGSITTKVSNGSNNYTYQWSNDSSSASLNNVCASSYCVTVTDEDCLLSGGSNCTASGCAEVQAGELTSISSNFNGTSISAGDYIWFSSVLKINGMTTTPVTIEFTGQTITWAGVTIPVPDAEITISPSSNIATTSFDGDAWTSNFPSNLPGNDFLSGVPYLVPAGGIAGGLNPVTWNGYFTATQSGITLQWQWAAAVYTHFTTNLDSIGVKPVDAHNDNEYQNADKAGTPENYKSYVTGGATGGGGGNFTGSYSPTGNVTPCVIQAPGTFTSCGYPDSSNLPRSGVAFNESTVLEFADLGMGCDVFRAWYSDEHAMTLGVRQVIVKTSTHSDTTNYPISIYSGAPGCVSNPIVGDTISSGLQSGNDVAAGGGRPLWPTLFITDITNNPNNRSGDWQQGGRAYPPTRVCGTWKAAVKIVDSTQPNGGTISVTPDADPSQNQWNTGNTDTPTVGFSALQNQGYGTEVLWDLTAMGLTPIPGHLYRVQLMVHDGDQNHSGGDVGEMCIEENFAPSVLAVGGQIKCNMDSVQIRAYSSSSGGTYHWSGPNGFTSTLQYPYVSVTGTYTVTATNPGNSCGDSTSTGQAIVTRDTSLQVTIQTQNVTCFGDSNGIATVSASGGGGVYHYSWSNGDSTSSVSHLTVGAYSVTVNSQESCSATDSVSISQPPLLAIIDSSEMDVSCFGDSNGVAEMLNDVQGGTLPYSYYWSNGDTGIEISGLKAGHYAVTVRDANGCTAAATVTVNQHSQLIASITSNSAGNVSCAITNGTAKVTASGGGGFYQYLWSNGATTDSISGLSAGTYTVTVSDQNNCTATASVTLNNTPPPGCSIGTVSPANLICNHGNYTISTNLSASLYTFAWTMSVDGNPAGWAIVGSSIGQTITFSAGDCGAPDFLVHFTLTVTGDSTGCTSTCSKTFAPGAPACNVDIRPPLPLTCVLTSEQLLSVYATDIINPTFTWTLNSNSIGSGLNNGVNLDSILITSPGTYRFTITDPADSANSCFAEVAVTQDITAPGATATGGVMNCLASTVQLMGSSSTSGVSFSWSGPNGFTSSAQNPVVTVAGTYTLTVTNTANGCTGTTTATVTQNTEGTGATATGGTITCTNTSVQLHASSCDSSATFSWSGPNGFSSTLQNPMVSVAGTYTVTATDAGTGASASASTSVTVNTTPPGASATGGNLTCIITSVQLMGSSPTAGATFSWSGPNGFSSSAPNPVVSTAGTYTLTVTNPANGCTSTATAVVTQTISDPSVTGGTITCTNTSVQLHASSCDSSATFSWSGPNGFSSTLQNPMVSVAGTYTVTATDAGTGASASASTSVTVNTTPPGASATGGNLTCIITSVQLMGSSPTAGATFSWSGPNGFSSSAPNPVVSTAGTYTLTVTNPANGCTSTATAVVTQTISDPSVTGGTITCTNTSVQLHASSCDSSATFSWSGPNGFSSTLQNPMVSVAGTYTVTATDAGTGASASASTSVTVNTTPPGASATGGDLTCIITSVQLMGSSPTAGATFSWSGPNGFSSSAPNPVVSTAGTYTLTVTNPANGCTSTATAVVTQTISDPSVTGGTITCTNTSVQLHASSCDSSATFSWSGPNGFSSTLQNPMVSVAGTYTVTATDAGTGASASASTSVTVNTTPPGASATGGNLTCIITSVQLMGSSPTPAVTYSWSGPNGFSSSAPNPVVSTAGTYTLTVTNPANGCTSTATAVVTQTISDPSVTGGTITCTNTSVQLHASSCDSSATFSWSGPNGFSSTLQNPMVSVAGTYTVTATDAGTGASASASTSVTVNTTPPGASATGGNLTCIITSVQLMGSSPTAGATFSWSGPNGFSSSAPNPVVSTAGTYTLTVTNPANGCTSTATAVVTQTISDPSVTGGTITCTNTSVQLHASSCDSSATFSWSGPNGFSSTLQNPMVSVAGTYTVTATDAGTGASASASTSVTVNTTPPGASATGGNLTCIITSVQLMGSSPTAGATFSWSGPNGFSSSAPNPVVSTAGTYTLTVANPANGCTSTATAVVTQTISDPSVTGGTITCTNTSVQLHASSCDSSATFSWSGPNGFSSTLQNPMVSVAGTYTVTATDAGTGASASASTSVTVNTTPPGASATGGNLTCIITSVQLMGSSPTAGATFSWSGPNGFSSSAPNPVVSTAGTYTLTVANPANGCTSTATAVVTQTISDPSVTGGTITCTNTSVQLHASSCDSSATFSWSGPNGFSSTLQNPMVSVAGTYTVTATDAGTGASASASTSVTVNTTPPGASATGGNLTCIITSVQLMGSSPTAGATFSWSGPNGFSSSAPNPVVSTAGTYTLTVANPANGCTSTATAVVTQTISDPSVTGGTITCTNTSVQLHASSCDSSATFSWSGPNGFSSTLQNPVVSIAGTYTVTATDAGTGASASASTSVTVNTTPPGASATGGNLTCIITSVQLMGSSPTAGATFSWSGPNGFSSSAPNPVVSTAGTYTLTVTNPANGCTSTATAVVTQTISDPSVTGGTITCTNTSVQLHASSCDSSATFSWSGPNGFSSTLQNPMVSVAGTYTVTATDAGTGASASASTSVTVNTTPPGASATGGALSCLITSVQLTGSSPAAGATYSWSGPNGFGSVLPNPVVSVSGTYTLTVTDRATGCTSTATAEVTQNITIPNASTTGGALTCTDSSVHITASSSTSGVTFQWSGPGGFTSTLASPTVYVSGTYTVIVTDTASGCTASATATVTLNSSPPGAAATGGQLTCIDTTVQLMGSSPASGVTFTWSGPDGFSSTIQNPVVSFPGTYTLTVTNPASGCTSTATAAVTQNVTDPDTATGGTLTCLVTSVQLRAVTSDSIATFKWSGPNGFSSTLQNPTVSVAGTYTVTITDAVTGCSVSTTAVVTVNNTPPGCLIGSVSPANIICNQGNYTLSTSLDSSLNTFSWTMSVDSNPAGWAIIGSSTGPSITFSAGDCGVPGFLVHFNLTVKDNSNGCTSTCSKSFAPGVPACNVDIRPPLTLTCLLSSEQLLAVYATDIINPTFTWALNGNSIGSGLNNGVNLDSIFITSPGTYRFTITDPADSANTCYGEVTVTQDITAPGASATGGELTCSGSTVQLMGSSSAQGATFSWSGPNGFSSTAQNPTVSITGTYTLTVTEPANGCTSTATAVVTQNISGSGASATGGTITCTSPSVQLHASSCDSSATFSWSGPNGFSSTLQNPTVSVEGTYTVTATDNTTGATATATASVTLNNTPPGATATGGALNCTTTSVQLIGSSPTSGVTYIWSGPNGFSSSLQSPLVSVSGTYTLTVTDEANGCSSTAAAVVTQNITAPGASATGGTITCTVTSVQLMASSPTTGVSFSWSGPGGFSSSAQNPTVSAGGTYTVTVTDSGCSSTATATVNVDTAAPVITHICGNMTFTCLRDTVQLDVTSSTPGATYAWSGPNGFTSTQQDPFVLVTGTYTVTVTNPANGCTATGQEVVTRDTTPPSISIIGGTLTCSDSPVQLFAESDSDVDFIWLGPNGFTSTLQDPTVNVPGVYTVIAIDEENCSASTSTSLIQAPGISIIDSFVTGVSCYGGDNGQTGLSNSVTGGTAPYYYLWSNGDTTVSIPGLVAGSYSVTVHDSRGCSATASVTVIQPAPLSDSITAINPGCGNTTGSATVTVSGGTAPYRYHWSNGDTTAIDTGLTAGPYSLTITDHNGCTGAGSITIIQTQGISILDSPATNVSCFNGSNGGASLVNLVIGGTLPYSYLWSNGDTTVTITGLRAGVYSVTVHDASGCPATAIITITQPPALTDSITAHDATCGNAYGSVAITVSGGTGSYRYLWSNGDTTAIDSDLNAGRYNVTITDQNGCTATASASLIQIQGLSIIDSFESNVSCYGDSNGLAELFNSVIGGTPPYYYLWSNGDTTVYTTSLSAGSYTVTVHDSHGCSATASVTIYQPTLITLADSVIVPSCDTCSNGAAKVIASGGTPPYTYRWSTGSTGDSIYGLTPGNYFVTVTDANGCTATVCAEVVLPLQADRSGGLTNSLLLAHHNQGNTTGVSGPASCGPELLLYPNPFTNKFHLVLQNACTDPINLKIYNLLGDVILESDGIPAEMDIPINNGAAGIYMVQVSQGDFKRTIRMIKTE